MRLNINSPAYFSKIHGIDDEIYWFFRNISTFVLDKKYSEIVSNVGLIPVVAPSNVLAQGLWKECMKLDTTIGLAIVSKQTDYCDYLDADIKGRKKMMLANILESVKWIERKGRFNYKQFEQDVSAFIYATNS